MVQDFYSMLFSISHIVINSVSIGDNLYYMRAWMKNEKMPQRFSKPYLNNFNLSNTAITFFSTFNSNLRKKVLKLISVNFLLQCHSSLYYYYYVLPTKFNTSLICYVHHGTFLHGNFFLQNIHHHHIPPSSFILLLKKSSNHNLSQKAISFSYIL